MRTTDNLVGGGAGAAPFTAQWVEARLRAGMVTLRRLPLPVNGIPMGDRSHWPEVVRAYWEQRGATNIEPAGATDAQTRKEDDVRRNNVRLSPSAAEIREMDECLGWLMLIRDGRKRKIVFARSQVHEESGRHLTSYRKLSQRMGCGREGLRLWYKQGILEIVHKLNEGGSVLI